MNEQFSYTYSAKENAEIKKIRDKYIEKPESNIEKIKRLDNKVQAAGKIEGLSIGIVGSLVFGVGMCFGLGVFIQSIILATMFCIIGTIIMVAAYPIYKKIYKNAYNKYVPEILELTKNI